MNYTNSIKAFERAQRYIPGGVNSPIRAFKSIRQTPPFIQRAKDATLWDIDNNQYTDYCLSWGVGILGHANEKIIHAVHQQVDLGTSYGAPTEKETSLASLLCDMVPSIQKVRFVSSGTEAVMSALRVARGFTGKNKIIKFNGCYHGHSDQLLVNAGSGVAENNTSASSAGVTPGSIHDIINIDFQDVSAVEHAFNQYKNEIAAVILEPIPGNMGVIETSKEFLAFLREITSTHKALLIFDEVISGFRVAKGGAQEFYGITPDITTLGKIIGGGFPIGAFGGKAEIMEQLAPVGPVYQAGTLSGNPVAVTAGIETLKQLNHPEFYTQLNAKANALYESFKPVEETHHIKINKINAMFSIHLGGEAPKNFDEVGKQDVGQFATFYKSLLKKGIYLSPSVFETNFVSIKHTQEQLKNLVKHVDESLYEVKASL